jgi:hypothetical protein
MSFTVKHRCAATGGEYLYSAETIEVVWPGAAKSVSAGEQAGSGSDESLGNYFESGIFLDREPPPAPCEDRTRFSKHIIQFGGDQTQGAKARKGGKVWVMNEAGATVATYEL